LKKSKIPVLGWQWIKQLAPHRFVVQYRHGKERTKRAWPRGNGKNTLASFERTQQTLDESRRKKWSLYGPNVKERQGIQERSNEVKSAAVRS
jgi:hypothetical protein